MGVARWSVRLAVDEAMSGPLTMALIDTVGNEIRGITLAGPKAEFDDGSDTVTFELRTVLRARLPDSFVIEAPGSGDMARRPKTAPTGRTRSIRT
jgi:hypothetical protein